MNEQNNLNIQEEVLDVNTSPKVENTSTEEKPKNKTNSSVIIIIALILVIILLLLYMFFFKTKEYTVVLIDGDNVELKVVKKGSKISANNTEENFGGWYYYKGEKCDIEKLLVDRNIILIAKYIKPGPKYTISFDTNGGSEMINMEVNENSLLPVPNTPTREGYIFKEWQVDGKPFDFNNPITGNIKLVAVWEKVDPANITYIVTFNTDGGNTINPVTVKENNKIGKINNPTKTGFNFKEWQLDGVTFNLNTPITKDIVLVAVWEVKEKVTITFDSDGGNTINPLEVYKGDKANLPTPTKTNFIFDGWYLNNTLYTSSTVIKNNVTLKAKWLSQEEANLKNAKKAIKTSYDITKAGQEILVQSTGCTITNTNPDVISKITRKTSDSSVTLNFSITCGNSTDTATAKGNIKASTYKYTAVANSNMQNYDLTVVGYSGNGTLYSVNGTYLSDITNGKAVINNADIENYPKFLIKLSDDNKTTYEISKK